jgi:hypothetical protein
MAVAHTMGIAPAGAVYRLVSPDRGPPAVPAGNLAFPSALRRWCAGWDIVCRLRTGFVRKTPAYAQPHRMDAVHAVACADGFAARRNGLGEAPVRIAACLERIPLVGSRDAARRHGDIDSCRRVHADRGVLDSRRSAGSVLKSGAMRPRTNGMDGAHAMGLSGRGVFRTNRVRSRQSMSQLAHYLRNALGKARFPAGTAGGPRSGAFNHQRAPRERNPSRGRRPCRSCTANT